MIPVRHGFPKRLRLRTAAEFKQVFDHARKSSDARIAVLACANDLRYPRLGLAIAKRQIRKANDRNAIKRLIRESFRLRQHTLGGIDFVVMARTAALRADHETLRKSLQRHWDNLVNQCNASWSTSSGSTGT